VRESGPQEGQAETQILLLWSQPLRQQRLLPPALLQPPPLPPLLPLPAEAPAAAATARQMGLRKGGSTCGSPGCTAIPWVHPLTASSPNRTTFSLRPLHSPVWTPL